MIHRLVIILVTAQTLMAGENLSLEEALRRAKTNNFDLLQARYETDYARGDKNKSYSVFLPQITLSEMAITTTDPLNVFGFKLKQEIVAQSDFNPTLLNDPKRIDNFTTKIEFKQPLINPDGLWGKSAAHNALNAMEQKEMRTGFYIEFAVKAKYYELVLARQSLAVIDKSLEAARANRDLAKNYFDQGMITQSDFLFADVRLLDLENKKNETENSIKNTNEALKLLLGIDNYEEIIPTDSLEPPKSLNFLKSIENINNDRSDMRAMKSGMLASQQMIRMQEFKFLPSLNAFGSYEWNDKKLFGTGGKNWMVGAMLKWDIFTGFDQVGEIQKAKAKYQLAKNAYQQNRLKNKNDLETALRNLETAKKKITLTGKAIQQASENFRILTDRYSKGMEKTTDLLNAEAMLANAQLDYLNALYFYTMNVFMLELLSEEKITD
ncbi:TolC family protein [bacterium]|nr:TolC family protein [bacterium]